VYDIYLNDRDDQWRYVLGKSGPGKLIVVGLNPSTATREKADNTVAKVERVASLQGYSSGFVMLNLYPVRGTDYRLMPDTIDPEAMETNLKWIEALVATEPTPTIWAAWGESVLDKPFFRSGARQLIDRVRKYKPRWLHYGALTQNGHPRHPRQLSYDWSFQDFDADTYLQKLT